jgi:translation initiation factor 1 (eIF-1/SUI1)
MNPFEDISTNNTMNTNTKIDIWVEKRGRKTNTYVSGWDIPEEELKEHIKSIKKNNGCNGTLKEISNESTEQLLKVIHLQGDHSVYFNKYLISHNIDPNNINIKG